MANGLLSNVMGNPMFNMGVGLLSASGPSTTPVSTGQALGQGVQFAQNAQQTAMRNQLVRSRLEQDARRRAATQKLGGLLGGGEQGSTLGLLAEIAPQQVAQGLIGQMFPQERAETSLVRNMRAAGIDPKSEEGQGIVRQNLAGQGTNDQLDQMLKTMQIQNMQQERREAQTTRQRERADAKISVIGGVERLREVAQINDRLQGTLGETGLGANELRSLAAGPISALTSALGGDAQRARQVAADLGRFEQLTTNEAVSSLFGGEVSAGTITDAKLGTFLKTKPGSSQLPETNRRIIADMLQSKLDSAEKLGIAIPDRDAVKAEIERLRNATVPTPAPPPGPQTRTGQGNGFRVLGVE